MNQDELSTNIDGLRYATAWKAVKATTGTDKANADTHDIYHIELWPAVGMRIATTDGARAAVAYVPVDPTDTCTPTDDPEFRATIKASEMVETLASVAGKDSDSYVSVSPWISDEDHLPGMEPPTGIRLSLNNGEAVASVIGTETRSFDVVGLLERHEPAPSSAFQWTTETLSSLRKLTSAIGGLSVQCGRLGDAEAVRITPADEIPGVTVDVLMRWEMPDE